MFGISMWELLLVGLILFLVVGPTKLPGLAKQLGQGIKDLRRNLNEVKGTVDKDDEFVKAVRDARRSVAEAKEAVRSIFDDVEESARESTPLPYDDEVNVKPPPQAPMPRGRKMIKPAPDSAAPAPAPDPSDDEEAAALAGGGGGEPGPAESTEETRSPPALTDEPVEAEVWRADQRSARPSGEEAPPPPSTAAPPRETTGAPPPAAGDVVEPEGPRGPSSRPRAGRRMVRPGRASARQTGGDSTSE
jgi:sec-independent protein translocase protein TatB